MSAQWHRSIHLFCFMCSWIGLICSIFIIIGPIMVNQHSILVQSTKFQRNTTWLTWLHWPKWNQYESLKINKTQNAIIRMVKENKMKNCKMNGLAECAANFLLQWHAWITCLWFSCAGSHRCIFFSFYFSFYFSVFFVYCVPRAMHVYPILCCAVWSTGVLVIGCLFFILFYIAFVADCQLG